MLHREAGGYSRWQWRLGEGGVQTRQCLGQPSAGVKRLNQGEGRQLMQVMQEGEERDVLARKRLADTEQTCRPDRWLRRLKGQVFKVREG